MSHSLSDQEGRDVERVFREVSGQAVATLVRIFRDITLAEDAVQDAFAEATDRWSEDGIPPNPAGWIITTARNRAVDVVRREARGRELQQQAAASEPGSEHSEEGPVADDQLSLIFTCCHPSLRAEHQIALTLRLVGGLRVDEIARSFLVSEAAMAKRLVRAKYKIKAARIPYRVPTESELPERLRAVLSVLYLIYNTGADDQPRSALRNDAVRLARGVVELMPAEPEAAGLLALILLNEARMPARYAGGELVLLRDQDRTEWDTALITEGHAIVRECLRRNRPGPYQLQAAIQAVHCHAETHAATDWVQLVTLYDQLLVFQNTPVVALNRAIALGEVAGPQAALTEMDRVAAHLDGYHLLHAARGTLLRRLGDETAASSAFRRAAELSPTERERRFLESQIGRAAGS